jgi:acyl-ACP thioesterase
LISAETIGTYTVKSTDIDIGNHMNNALYVRAFFGFISCDDLTNSEPTEIEIAFKSPCFENEVLNVKQIKTEENLYLAFLHEDTTVASVIKLTY